MPVLMGGLFQGSGNLPVEAEFEVVGHEGIGVGERTAAGPTGESAFLDDPVAVVLPAVEGLAVGEGDELPVVRGDVECEQQREKERNGLYLVFSR